MDVRRSHGLLCRVRRAADVPALSSVLPRHAAAQRPSQCSGGGPPAALAGPGQPQCAAAHSHPGYDVEIETWPTASPPVYSLFFFFLISFSSEGHWLVKRLWESVQGTDRPAAPLLLAPVEIIPPHKDAGSARPSYPPSSTPQK